MNGKKLNRRDFLRMAALTAAGAALASCTKEVEVIREVEVEKEVVQTVEVEKIITATPPSEPVWVIAFSSNPEYHNAERQIWDLFEAQHPGIKIELQAMNEDNAAAVQTQVAAGWTPGVIHSGVVLDSEVTATNYEVLMDLSEIDFPWFDRWTWDIKNAWSDQWGVPGPRVLNWSSGIVTYFHYNVPLMEAAGLNPRRDIKTWDDLLKFLEEGTAWANANPDVDYFWDEGWCWGWFFNDIMPKSFSLAFPEGQQERQNDCWWGRAKFNADDSPFRSYLEFIKLAYDSGWLPESFWTRGWETDMEASYIAQRSVLCYHGPWLMDKALAANPATVHSGFPPTPPAEGQGTWMQIMEPIQNSTGGCMLDRVKDTPEWEQVKTAFFWWFSPEAVKMQAEVQGVMPLYRLDEEAQLTGPGWEEIVSQIGTPGGLWEDVQWVDPSNWGYYQTGPYRSEDYTGQWLGGMEQPDNWMAYLTGGVTTQELLDNTQAWFDKWYDIPEGV